jgi:hypothetical protein
MSNEPRNGKGRVIIKAFPAGDRANAPKDEEEEDPLAAARGCFTGVLSGLLLLALAVIIWLVRR